MTREPRRILGTIRRRGSSEEGAVAVIVALMLVLLLGATALVWDLSRLRHDRQMLQAAVDFAALAGAQELPVSNAAGASAAVSWARTVALANAPQIPATNLLVSFRCYVSDPEHNGGQDSPDLSYACGPHTAGSWSGGWTTKRDRAWHACDPYSGDLCNTILVTASHTIDYDFAPVIGITQGNTGSLQGASCRGYCGQPSGPLDVVMVLDRTSSMTVQDLANAKNAALSVLDVYDPSLQWVGLVGLPYGDPTNKCNVNHTQNYPNTTDIWKLSDFSSDYKDASGNLNPSSDIVRTINCLQRPPGNMVVNPSGSGHTDLGDAFNTANHMLMTGGRANVPNAIIFFTDGEANQPRYNQPCTYFNTRGDTAKASGTEVFTIGYGVAAARCSYDTSGQFRNAYASTVLAAVASNNSHDNAPGGCAATENTDGDNYFCEAAGQDLEDVFRLVAIQTLKHSHLVDI
jgi:hypothetical protein